MNGNRGIELKHIGFIDYYLSEWHANNYPAWIKKAARDMGLNYKVSYAWGEKDVSPVDGVDSAAWCAEIGAVKCASLEEVCEKSDVLLILAPSNPETHLGYAKRALPFGKITYIDKTFAPDEATAREIFALSDRFSAPVFSSSALGFASELEGLEGSEAVLTAGGGASLDEYIIHQAEMTAKLIEEEPEKILCERQGTGQRIFHIRFSSGKSACMVYDSSLKFFVCAEAPDGTSRSSPIVSDKFGLLIRDILRFYETGIPSFDRSRTLRVMRLRDAAIAADRRKGEWLELRREG